MAHKRLILGAESYHLREIEFMNAKANYIRNRLSLRSPQAESLEILQELTDDRIHDFKETITPTSAIPSKVFVGFQKACHLKYKFDSKTEKDFSILLEEDREVIKWMRPSRKQFTIHFERNTRKYEIHL